MSIIKIAEPPKPAAAIPPVATSFLSSDSVPTDANPTGNAAPTPAAKPGAAPSAPAAPGAPGAGPAPAAGGSRNPKSKHVARMQSLMLDVRKEFFSSNFKNEDGTTSHTAWDTFASSMFQRHLDHNTSKKSGSFIDKLESISLIGGHAPSGKGENASSNPVADGVWGDKTSAGLKSICDLASMMLSVAGKFQISLHFADEDIKQIRSQIPKDASHIDNIDERANQISESLSKMADSVAGFITSVEQSMRTNREGAEVAAGYDGKKENTKATFPGVGGIQLNSKQFAAPIALSHLFTKEQLVQFLTANKINVDVKSDEAMSNYLTSLEEGIKSGTITLTMGNDPNKILQTRR